MSETEARKEEKKRSSKKASRRRRKKSLNQPNIWFRSLFSQAAHRAHRRRCCRFLSSLSTCTQHRVYEPVALLSRLIFFWRRANAQYKAGERRRGSSTRERANERVKGAEPGICESSESERECSWCNIDDVIIFVYHRICVLFSIQSFLSFSPRSLSEKLVLFSLSRVVKFSGLFRRFSLTLSRQHPLIMFEQEGSS